MGSKPKSDKRVKKVKRHRKVNSAVKGEQWCRRQFRNLRNFAGCKNFATLLSTSSLIMVSASLFFWFLTCSSEFDSNSLCLDRLNNFGIISLQKTIKLATKCNQQNNRDLNLQIGLITLISTQKVLKTCNKHGSK